MRTRIELQPLKTVTAAEIQETRFAAALGNAKTAVVFVNTVAVTGISAFKITFQTATSPDRGSSFWTGAAAELDCTTAGVHVTSLSNLGDVVRWNITSYSGTNATFEVVIFTQDT